MFKYYYYIIIILYTICTTWFLLICFNFFLWDSFRRGKGETIRYLLPRNLKRCCFHFINVFNKSITMSNSYSSLGPLACNLAFSNSSIIVAEWIWRLIQKKKGMCHISLDLCNFPFTMRIEWPSVILVVDCFSRFLCFYFCLSYVLEKEREKEKEKRKRCICGDH